MNLAVETLIESLAGAPAIITGLVREMPPRHLKRRPSPTKWSAHEHACHITMIDAPYLARLELMLSDPSPRQSVKIVPMSATPDEEAGALLDMDLDAALASYARERARLVARLRELSDADWQRTASHEEYSQYSVWIMFRQLLLHEMQHAYRIEDLRLRKGWT